MDKIQCTITIDNDNNQIKLSGLSLEELLIDYTTDVDFTELVSTLAILIDGKKEISPLLPNLVEDEKLKLIIETIEEIIQKYNNTVSSDALPNLGENIETAPLF